MSDSYDELRYHIVKGLQTQETMYVSLFNYIKDVCDWDKDKYFIPPNESQDLAAILAGEFYLKIISEGFKFFPRGFTKYIKRSLLSLSINEYVKMTKRVLDPVESDIVNSRSYSKSKSVHPIIFNSAYDATFNRFSRLDKYDKDYKLLYNNVKNLVMIRLGILEYSDELNIVNKTYDNALSKLISYKLGGIINDLSVKSR